MVGIIIDTEGTLVVCENIPCSLCKQKRLISRVENEKGLCAYILCMPLFILNPRCQPVHSCPLFISNSFTMICPLL